MATYLVMVSLMIMLPSSVKPVLVLSFDFWVSRFRTFTCRNWGINDSHTLLEVCPAHTDKVEIKCMGSVGGKTPIEPNLCLFFSLALGTSNHVTVDIMCIIHSYNMGDKIRRIRMNMTFEYIYQKEWSYLTYGRIVHL